MQEIQAPMFKGETTVQEKAKALRVYQRRETLIAVSEDHMMAYLSGRYALMLALDTENYGRLLYPVSATVREISKNLVDVNVDGQFVLEANDIIYINSLRLAIMRDGKYIHPMLLNGKRVIELIALAPGVKITIKPEGRNRYVLPDYRAVIDFQI